MNDNTRELVACNVQATPALTRRIRKAALVEQNGQDPRAALMIAAGYDPNEVHDLQSRVSDLTDEASENYKRLTSLTAKAERCAIDLLEARKQLDEKNKSEQILHREQNVLSERLAAVKDDLRQSVNIHNLPHEIADNIQSVVQAIRGGDDPRSAFLSAAKYDRAAVDGALSSVNALKTVNVDLKSQVAPLNAVLKTGGLKALVVRQVLGI
jgi:chromosome segregation ATPase